MTFLIAILASFISIIWFVVNREKPISLKSLGFVGCLLIPLPFIADNWSYCVIIQTIFTMLIFASMSTLNVTRHYLTRSCSIMASLTICGLIYYGPINNAYENYSRVSYPTKSFEVTSVQDRLPEPNRMEENAKLIVEKSPFITALESQIEPRLIEAQREDFEAYHRKKIDVFASSLGAGVDRGIELRYRTPFTGSLAPFWRQGRTVVPSTENKEIMPKTGDKYEELLQSSILDFGDPFRFGIIKDRMHVAGYQSHLISDEPKMKELKVERLDLVSLLLNAEPAVYETDELPQMEKLKGVPTRPLDEFESMGLKKLQAGENLYIREYGDGIRMLGAVRNVKQCVACHGGERGDLLGAFSYVLRK